MYYFLNILFNFFIGKLILGAASSFGPMDPVSVSLIHATVIILMNLIYYNN
jgi:hypothetical protein